MERLKDNERSALVELKKRLALDFAIVEVKLFGSKARGDSDRESDIDVLIVLDSYDWETQKAIYGLCFDIGLEHGVLLAPVLYSRAEYLSPRTRATSFYRNVVREGLPV